MWQGPIALALILVSSALFVIAAVMTASGVHIRMESACWQWAGCGRFAGGGSGVPHLIVPAGPTLLGLGYAALALGGLPRVVGQTFRRAVGMLAVGLLMFVVATNLPIPAGTNPAQHLEVILLYGLGLSATVYGFVVAGVLLLRVPWHVRFAVLALPVALVSLVAPWLPVGLVVVSVVAYRMRRSRQERRQGAE